MDIQVLNNFLVVAREGNITKSAGLVHLTQSALSRQMINLEGELGARLFERQKYTVALTDAGMIFRRRAQEIVTLSDLAKNELQQAEEEITGEIAVGCNESQSMTELSALIVQFRALHPLVTFDIHSGSNGDIKEQLDRGIVEFGLLGEPVDVKKYSHITLKKKDEWGILISENNPLAAKNAVRAEDLAGIPMITIRDEVIHGELTSWAGKYAGRMIPVMHYNLLSNAASLIADSTTVAVCARPSCLFNSLTFRPLDPPLALGSLIAWKEPCASPKTTQAFLDFLKSAVQK